MSQGVKLPTKLPISPGQEKIRVKKDLFIRELEKTPIVTHACTKVGVSSTTFYRWRAEDSEFAERIVEAQSKGNEQVNDFAVSMLIQLMKNGEMRAINMWLSHRHPDFNRKYAIATNIININEREVNEELTQEDKDKIAHVLKNLRGAMRVVAERSRNGRIETSEENDSLDV